MEFGLQLLKTAAALGLVLGLFFALIYALRRWGNLTKKAASRSEMEILSKQSFGPRHHLILVKVPGDRKVLVGVSPQNMSLLDINEPALSDAGDAADNV